MKGKTTNGLKFVTHKPTMLTKALTVANNKNSFATLNKLITILGVSSFSERKAKKHPISHDGLKKLLNISFNIRNKLRSCHKKHIRHTTQIFNNYGIRPHFFKFKAYFCQIKTKNSKQQFAKLSIFGDR